MGGVIGGRLLQAGHDVTLVARGEHAATIRRAGLRLDSPDGVDVLRAPVVDTADLADFAGTATVLLSVKSQDTAAAVRDLSRAGVAEAVVCVQNGVVNEPMALRCFDSVYGICVMLPAEHLEPGVVAVHSSPIGGILDIGRYPAGSDDRAAEIAEALAGATFLSEPRADIMRWKYRKLIMNLGNAVQALCGRLEAGDPVLGLVREEAERCFAAAGVDSVTAEEDRVRRADHITLLPVPGHQRSGGSSYQSLLRAQGSIETDYLNGEICLLGRLHGVATPANAVVQRLANRAAANGSAPGVMTAAELFETVTQAIDGKPDSRWPIG